MISKSLSFPWTRIAQSQHYCPWDWITLGGGGCPVYCRVSSNIPGIYTLDANNTLRVLTTKNISKRCQISWGAQSPWLRSRFRLVFPTLPAHWNDLESFRNCCQYLAPSRSTKQDTLRVGPWHWHFSECSRESSGTPDWETLPQAVSSMKAGRCLSFTVVFLGPNTVIPEWMNEWMNECKERQKEVSDVKSDIRKSQTTTFFLFFFLWAWIPTVG